MKKNIFLIILITGFCVNLFSQEDDYEKHYVGGQIGMQFGTVINLSVSPHYGHYIFPFVSVGAGLSYQYFSDAFYSPPLKLSIFGGRVFARIDPIDAVFIHAEYELLTYKTDIFSPVRDMEQIISENVLVGGGYRQMFSDMSKDCMYIMLLYNLNETIYTPYSNPVIRLGVELHF